MVDHDVAILAPADDHEVPVDGNRRIAVLGYQLSLHRGPMGLEDGSKGILRQPHLNLLRFRRNLKADMPA